jgi:hypothetical protein
MTTASSRIQVLEDSQSKSLTRLPDLFQSFSENSDQFLGIEIIFLSENFVANFPIRNF